MNEKTEETITYEVYGTHLGGPEKKFDPKKYSKRSDLSAPMVGKYPRLMGNV